MITFEAQNSTEMAQIVYPALDLKGLEASSRNGKVIYFPEPVTMTYTQPWIRGNNTPHRDANPFFHIAESMWMLAGRKDVEFLTMFNSNMSLYSDDGETFNAPYGYRLRHHFGFDQLKAVVAELREESYTRQAVCQLWDPADLGKDTKDKACNMQMVFAIIEDRLRLTIYNRSNDLIYGGVTGANPVHFSYFQQWVADQLQIPMGELIFVVNNAHVYTELYSHWDKVKKPKPTMSFNSYPSMLGTLAEVEALCDHIMLKEPITSLYKSTHLNCVVIPIINAFLMRKYGDYTVDEIHGELGKCQDDSLFEQCSDWLEKRNES